MPPHSGWGLLRALLPGPSHAVSREARSCSKTQHLLLPLNKRTPQEKKTPQVTCYQDIGLKLVPCQGSHQHLSIVTHQGACALNGSKQARPPLATAHNEQEPTSCRGSNPPLQPAPGPLPLEGGFRPRVASRFSCLSICPLFWVQAVLPRFPPFICLPEKPNCGVGRTAGTVFSGGWGTPWKPETRPGPRPQCQEATGVCEATLFTP